VRKNLAKRALRQRVIAFAAAYAIALAGLIASFGAAQAAAAWPGGIICHTDIAGESAPSPNGSSDKICADCCCTGCLMLTAALPPPSSGMVSPLSASERIAPLPILASISGPQAKSHRSRAPPQTA
jgi:hypothetical protein